MGALAETSSLIQKYPLTFLAAAAVTVLAFPVASTSMAPALRPWAKRLLGAALAVRGEALRIAAESREAYADLLAEVVSEAEAPRGANDEPARRTPVQVTQRFPRVEPASCADNLSPAA